MTLSVLENDPTARAQASFDVSHVQRQTGLAVETPVGLIAALRTIGFASTFLALVALIAYFDYGTGPELSFSIFYLIPIVVASWCGSFAHGILLSLAATVAWHLVDGQELHNLAPSIALWNSITRFGTMVLVSSLVARLHGSVLREQMLARIDALTGAANGRVFYEAIAREIPRARRYRKPLTLAYFDLDNFKQVNDQLGHAVGDLALIRVVKTLLAHMRLTDTLARLGGDEFALLLPETDGPGAVQLLQRLQAVLNEEMRQRTWPVSVSIGAVSYDRPLDDVDQMVQSVDALMYEAKRSGKNGLRHQSVTASMTEQWRPVHPRDRRATARTLCNRPIKVRREGDECPAEMFAHVYDISVNGIGLLLETRIPDGTVLIVEPLSPHAKTLLARVLHAAPRRSGFMHGCQLSTHLTEEEIRHWSSGEPSS